MQLGCEGADWEQLTAQQPKENGMVAEGTILKSWLLTLIRGGSS